MPILSPADQEYLRQVFTERLREPVTIRLFTQRVTQIRIPGYECATCRETNELLQEVASLSDKLTLEMYDLLQDADEAGKAGVEEIPAIVLVGQNKGTVRFIGVPAGYEFATRGHHRCLSRNYPAQRAQSGNLGETQSTRSHQGFRHPYLTVLSWCRQVGAHDGDRE